MKRGITCGVFDLLHAGHVAMLQEAKSVCDHLTVALQIDPQRWRADKNKPVQTLVERQIQLMAVKYVDQIIVYDSEQSLEDIFVVLPFNIRIIGEEYQGNYFTAKDICKKRNIEIYYNDTKHNFSSTNLKKFIRKHKD